MRLSFEGLLTPIANLDNVSQSIPSNNNESGQISEEIGERGEIFDIHKFVKECHQHSHERGYNYAQQTQSISGYDMLTCISSVVRKLLNHPVPSYAANWLPVIMRGVIGTAIHDFIQDTSKQFTEVEASIKVPSIRFSGRLDAMICSNILVEIKSMTYKDYRSVLKKKAPRMSDFYQCIAYKYILENFLKESQTHTIKTRTPPPKLNKYNIDTIQLIYVAHDISCGDCTSYSQAMKKITEIKKILKSGQDPFFFMTTLVLDLNTFDYQPYLDFVRDKIDAINYFVSSNTLPDRDNPYINRNDCYFCKYGNDCKVR